MARKRQPRLDEMGYIVDEHGEDFGDHDEVPCKPKARRKKRTKRKELIEGYAYYRANTAVKDAENSTSYTEEFQVLARQVAEHMTDEELEAYLKEHEDEN